MSMRTKSFVTALSAASVLSLAGGLANALPVTIFEDNFDGGSGDLDGTTPDTTTAAAKWVAPATWNADGSVAGGSAGGSATLAFTPVDGQIYTLDVSLGASSYAGGAGSDNDWFAIGFSRGQSNVTGGNERFIQVNVVGVAWALQRGPDGGTNTTFLGIDGGGSSTGTQNTENWAAQTGLTGGNTDLRIVLNTTGGAGTWTAEFLAKGTADANFSVIRAAELLATENIDSVGIARSSGDITGSLTSFSVTSVPEPGSLALLSLGGLLIARRRRA